MQVTVYVVTFHGVPNEELNYHPEGEIFDTTVGVGHTFSEALDNMKSSFEEDEVITDYDNMREYEAYYTTNYGNYRIERHIMWIPEKIF